ncbi:MAG: hypothetical protein ACLFRT_07710 [Actinomycetota bacterium]
MRTKILASFLAGGLVVGAGFATLVISAPGTAQAHEATPEDAEDRPLAGPFWFIEEVLDQVVEDGTITSDQADAIVDAASAKVTELKEQRRERLEDTRRHLRHGFRGGFRLGALLDDGGVDESEYEDLGENHPLKRVDVDEYLDDGLITPEELREILREFAEARFGSES